jgi:hypothetical protein
VPGKSMEWVIHQGVRSMMRGWNPRRAVAFRGGCRVTVVTGDRVGSCNMVQGRGDEEGQLFKEEWDVVPTHRRREEGGPASMSSSTTMVAAAGPNDTHPRGSPSMSSSTSVVATAGPACSALKGARHRRLATSGSHCQHLLATPSRGALWCTLLLRIVLLARYFYAVNFFEVLAMLWTRRRQLPGKYHSIIEKQSTFTSDKGLGTYK